MSISHFATPRPNQPFLSQFPRTPAATPPSGGAVALGRRRHPSTSPKLTLALCSTSTSTPVVEDGLPPPPATDEDGDKANIPLGGGCKACGSVEIERGCNGEGRIQGGIATVPGFGWWPIKAYRPCPGFVASGGRYRRRGQSMDEVAFGRGERGGSSSTSISMDIDYTSKKQKDPRKVES